MFEAGPNGSVIAVFSNQKHFDEFSSLWWVQGMKGVQIAFQKETNWATQVYSARTQFPATDKGRLGEAPVNTVHRGT